MPFIDDPGDPYSTHILMGWIRSWMLAKQIDADLSDQAAIDRDYARMVAASDARDAQFWADMRADGVPVADPEPDPEPGSFAERYAAAVAEAQAGQWVADHAPAAGEPAADVAPEPEPEASL
jgi:hypothetical protein